MSRLERFLEYILPNAREFRGNIPKRDFLSYIRAKNIAERYAPHSRKWAKMKGMVDKDWDAMSSIDAKRVDQAIEGLGRLKAEDEDPDADVWVVDQGAVRTGGGEVEPEPESGGPKSGMED